MVWATYPSFFEVLYFMFTYWPCWKSTINRFLILCDRMIMLNKIGLVLIFDLVWTFSSYLRCLKMPPLLWLFLYMYVQGISNKSGIRKLLTFCVIALVPLSSKENKSCFHKPEFIVVILSIIELLSSKWCLKY